MRVELLSSGGSSEVGGRREEIHFVGRKGDDVRGTCRLIS